MIEDFKQYTNNLYNNVCNNVKRFTIDNLSKYLYSFYDNSVYKSKFKDNYICYEYFNPKLIKWLLKNENKVKKILGDKNNKSNYLFNMLDVLNKTNIKGFIKTIYNDNYCGRYYALNNISLQNMWRQIRQILSFGLYYDIDIINCHPRILASVCEKNDIKCPSIIEYRDNREKHINDLIKLNNKPREYIKKMIISILNGGTKDYKKCKKTQFLIKLYNEYEKIVDVIVNKNIKTYDKCFKHNLNKNERNKEYNQTHNTYQRILLTQKQLIKKSNKTTISYFLMKNENNLLQYMIKYFKDNQLIKNDLYICIFDGFQFDKSNHKKEDINIHLRILEDNILRDLKIDIKLKIKDFDNCKELLKIIPKKLFKKSIPIHTLTHLIKSKQFDKKRCDYTMSNIDEIKADITYNNNKIDGKYRIPPFFKEYIKHGTLFIKSVMGSGKTHQLYEILRKLLEPQYEYIDEKSIISIDNYEDQERTHTVHNYRMSIKQLKNKCNCIYCKKYGKKTIILKSEKVSYKKEINKYNKPSILFIGFRKTLEHKYIKDFNNFKELKGKFVYYEDIKDRKIKSSKYPYLVMQINSLHKIQGKYDVIIFDEISYTLDMFLSFCEKRQEVKNKLNEICHTADKIVCMDAYMSNREIDFIKSIRTNHKSCTILNKNDEIKGLVKWYEYNAFEQKIIKLINKGKRVVIASNSLNFIENKLTALCKKYNINALFITKNSKNIKSCDNWNKYNLVAYTPTVTAGLSFDDKHFDYCFGYFSNMSAQASICCQQLFRVRYTTNKDIHICINENGKKDYPTTYEGIKDYLNDYLNLHFELFKNNLVQKRTLDVLNTPFLKDEYDDINKIQKYVENDYFRLLVDYFKKMYRSVNNLKSELRYYLKIQGYDDSYDYDDNFNENIKKEHYEIIDEFKKYKMVVDAKLYRDTECPTFDDIKDINYKTRKSKLDKVKLNLYEIKTQNINIKNRSDNDIKILINHLYDIKFDYYIEKSKKKNNNLNIPIFLKSRIIKNLEKNKSVDNNFDDYAFDDCLNYNIELDKSYVDSHQQTKRDYWLKCSTSYFLVNVLGFKDIYDKETKIIFDQDKRNQIYKYFIARWKIFEQLFKVDGKMKNKQTFFKQQIAKILNDKLNIINRKLTSKRIKVNNKRHYVYTLEKLFEK